MIKNGLKILDNNNLKHDDESLRNCSDSDVWSLFKNGDELAFTYIYTNYFDILYQYGLHFTYSKALIEDAIHDLFVELSQHRRRLSDVSTIQPYLYKAFKRKIIRLRDREKRIFNEPSKQALKCELVTEETDRVNHIGEDMSRVLKLAMKHLSGLQREVIHFYFYKEFSYEEIRLILEFKKVKSVRNLMYRILDSIRVYMILYKGQCQ